MLTARTSVLRSYRSANSIKRSHSRCIMSAAANDVMMSAKSASAGRREVNNPHMKEVLFKRNVVMGLMLRVVMELNYHRLLFPNVIPTQILFVEIGSGCDGHGQNVTVHPDLFIHCCLSMF